MRPSDEHWCGRPPSPPPHPRPPTPRLMWRSRSSRSGAGVDPGRHPCGWCVDVWCWLVLGAGGVVSAFRRSAGASSSGCSRVGLGRACAQGARATVALLRSSRGRGVYFSLVRTAGCVCSGGKQREREIHLKEKRKKERKKERKALGTGGEAHGQGASNSEQKSSP